MRLSLGWVAAGAAGLVLVLAAGVVSWRLVVAHGHAAPKEEVAAPSAFVTITPVRAATIYDTIVAYGVISGSSAEGRTVVAPRDVIVEKIFVAPGESVGASTPLVQLADTPAAQMAYRDAVDALAFAQKNEGQTERLYAAHMATNDQLAAARKTLADARSAVAAETASGAGAASQTIRAPVAGIVVGVSAIEGGRLAAGAPIVSVAPASAMIADFRVEPPQAVRLLHGQPVKFHPVFDAEHAFDARLELISSQIDAQGRFVRVTAPASEAKLPLGTAVEGAITVSSHPGLLAPQNSVVYDTSGTHVFLDQAGVARLVQVKTGVQQGADIEIIRPLSAGQPLIVEGAYQVQDGMAVRTASR